MRFSFYFLLLVSFFGKAQDPSFFQNSVETGAPSNEIYWLHQDKSGYIWIGCDAGIYKYNGVRYEHFTSPDLSARSATGIIQSKRTGRIYGYNFNRQLFYIENNKLKVVNAWKYSLNGLADDHHGNIWITSSDGVFTLNEKTLSIRKVNSSLHYADDQGRTYSSHGISNPLGAVYYQCGRSIIIRNNQKFISVPLSKNYLHVNLLLSRFSILPWAFSYNGDIILRNIKGKYHSYDDPILFRSLKGKKINCVFESKDGKIWIGTYSGLVCHNPKTRKTEIFYKQFSFSFGIEDSQGNFWFSTLHNGFIRIPNFNIRYWDSKDENGTPDQFNQLSFSGKEIFVGGSYGFIGKLHTRSSAFRKIEHFPAADFGMIYWDKLDRCLYFNKNGDIFRFQNGKFSSVNRSGRPIKSMIHTADGYFFLSSQGIYHTSSIKDLLTEQNMIDSEWYRDISTSPFSKAYFAASNNGLIEIGLVNGSYCMRRKYLAGKQILSIAKDSLRRKIYFLSFEGGVYELDASGHIREILWIEDDVRATQLHCRLNRLYCATNKGIMMISLDHPHHQLIFNKYAGLKSNNIKALTFENDFCWTAGEGIHRIPISAFKKDNAKSWLRLIGVEINDISLYPSAEMQLESGDKIDLVIDGMSYRSNDQFQYAYRIPGFQNSWTMVPGTLRSIDFSSLPNGNVTVEVKLVDHQGNDSQNIVRQSFYVRPPFWQRWWFYFLMTFVTLATAYAIFRWRLNIIRTKQHRELKRLRLENELRLTQQNALKAQMNPHFLFNVLNSIKGYIYDNDKKNATRYLSDFSGLVRKVLEFSSLPTVSLEQEIELLKLYIELEAMLLQSDFEYSIELDETLDIAGIQIPALLLQPYVENSFKHGLRHKMGPKYLKIAVTMNAKESILKVIITDNGIGRKASAAINEGNKDEHKSFATDALEKRLQLLNFDKKDLVGVEIFDNFEGTVPTGTTVIILLHV